MAQTTHIVIGIVAVFAALLGAAPAATTAPAAEAESSPPLYLLTYDHGALVLWGRDHFQKHLHSAVEWLDPATQEAKP